VLVHSCIVHSKWCLWMSVIELEVKQSSLLLNLCSYGVPGGPFCVSCFLNLRLDSDRWKSVKSSTWALLSNSFNVIYFSKKSWNRVLMVRGNSVKNRETVSFREASLYWCNEEKVEEKVSGYFYMHSNIPTTEFLLDKKAFRLWCLHEDILFIYPCLC